MAVRRRRLPGNCRLEGPRNELRSSAPGAFRRRGDALRRQPAV